MILYKVLYFITDTRHDHAERRKLFRNYTVGSYDSFEAAR
jgi:hypothetical protein